MGVKGKQIQAEGPVSEVGEIFKGKEFWIPVIVFLLATAGVYELRRRTGEAERQRVKVEAEVTAHQVQLRLEAWIGARLGIVSYMGRRGGAGPDVDESSFRQEASQFIELYPGFQALNWIDPGWVIRIVVPEVGNRDALGKDLHWHPASGVKEALARALESGRMARTPNIQLIQGGAGFATYEPVYDSDGYLMGFVNGVFRFDTLVGACLAEADFRQRFRFELADEFGATAYRHEATSDSDPWTNLIELPVRVADRDFSLRISLSPSYLAASEPIANRVSTAFGLLLAVVLAWLLRLLLLRQQSLSVSENQLTAILDSAPLMMMLVDRNRRIRRLNRLAGTISDESGEDPIGLRTGQALRCVGALEDPDRCEPGSPCSNCVVRSAILETLESGESILRREGSLRIRTGDGTERDESVLVSTSRTRMRGEELVLVYIEDISDLRLSEAALRASEMSYKNLFMNSPVSIWREDLSGIAEWFAALRAEGVKELADHLRDKPSAIREAFARVSVVDVNPSAVEMLEAGDKIELLGQLSKTFTDESNASFGMLLCEIWNGKSRGTIDSSGRTLKGKPLSFRVDYSIPPSPTGPKMGDVIVTMSDITARKRAEAEARALEVQMQRAQKLESLGILAGGIAHDFNNILVAVLGNAEIALAEPITAGAKDSLNSIVLASRRAADLCRQMLAYSGKGSLVREPLHIAELVEEMSSMIEVSISKRAVLRFDFSSLEPAVDGDPTQIRQVILNLITNASEALGEDDGVIAIATGSVMCEAADFVGADVQDDLPAGVYAYIEVKDSGCGMDELTRSKLFEPFFSTKFTGRGLGMAAVLGIVRGHGGAIQVSSKPGAGSTFRVLLPARKVDADRADHAEPRQAARAPGGLVLLVDDEESVRTVAARLLAKAGYETIVARDGIEAERIFRENADRIDCVLLDMIMPHKGGFETFEAIRRIRSHVPIILTSGCSNQEIEGRFEAYDSIEFIQKPYGFEELVRSVEAAVRSRGAELSQRSGEDASPAS